MKTSDILSFIFALPMEAQEAIHWSIGNNLSRSNAKEKALQADLKEVDSVRAVLNQIGIPSATSRKGRKPGNPNSIGARVKSSVLAILGEHSSMGKDRLLSQVCSDTGLSAKQVHSVAMAMPEIERNYGHWQIKEAFKKPKLETVKKTKCKAKATA